MDMHTPDPEVRRGTRSLFLAVAVICFALGLGALVLGAVITYRGHQQDAQSARSAPPPASPTAPVTTGQGAAIGQAADQSRKDMGNGRR
jgi:hypothetical protein